MKKLTAGFLLLALLFTACSADTTIAEVTEATSAATGSVNTPLIQANTPEIPYESRFDSVTVITLSDSGITVDGGSETATVFTSNDIVYYEDKTAYESGNPYGEGTAADMHSAEEAAAHTVVNITAAGAYRLSGKLSAGQIRIDLGDDAYDDPNAVVELILDNADITCTVAPAILFLNVYECDGAWSTETAKAEVDTTAAGANLVLENTNVVNGAYVAKIYKDKDGEKKLWKQDGAIYSYMSLNVFGPGSLDLTASNEGLDSELHLTINGGNIAIRSDNDGINTNEDGVSVTTINAGSVHIIAGLGAEGDGIDSNGYLVINGGTVVSAANPAADAGLDSDLGSFVNGGLVIALGSTMDWAESDSNQVTMNLQFAAYQSSGSAVVITREDGTVVYAYDPSEDEVLGENVRRYQGAVISSPNLIQGQSYLVYLDGTVTGQEVGGMYDVTTVTGYTGGTQMMYTGTDVSRFPGGMGNFPGGMGGNMGGQRPNGNWGNGGQMPEGFDPNSMGGQMPEGFDPNSMGGWGNMPDGFDPNSMGGQMPEGFDPSSMGGWGNQGGQTGDAENANTIFYMQDKVNAFSGVTAMTE